MVWDSVFCPVVGADASCEFTCGGPRTTMGVILWAPSTILFVCFVFWVWNQPQGCTYLHFLSVDYSCILPCTTFFFLNMGFGCWARVLRPSRQVLHQVSSLCRLTTICFNQWQDYANIVFRCRFIVQAEWICFMKDQCALLTFCLVTPKGDRLSYMVCGGGGGCLCMCQEVYFCIGTWTLHRL